MPFKNPNVERGIPKNGQFQVGDTNIDPGLIIERGIEIPTVSDASTSWVYFDCSLDVMLDSGIVVHHKLPQVNNAFDTLAMVDFDDPSFDKKVTGVNLRCADQYQDIVQRMGHARYWFRLHGQALRFGHQIPIPGIKTIGGVPAIPYDKNPQWATNSIVPGGNYAGVILWRAAWSLWYTTAVPPVNNKIPAADPSAHISSAAPETRTIQSPFSQADDNASIGNIAGAIGGGFGAGFGRGG